MRAWQCGSCRSVLVDTSGQLGKIKSEFPKACPVCDSRCWTEVSASGYTAEQGLPTAVRLTIIATEAIKQ